MPYKDPDVQREYMRQYNLRRRKTDPEFREAHYKRRDRWQKAEKERRAKVLAEFRKDGCVACGEDEAACLDAHHLDPRKKSFSVGVAGSMKVSHRKLAAELEKCICICSNCHRKLHAGIITLKAGGPESKALVS